MERLEALEGLETSMPKRLACRIPAAAHVELLSLAASLDLNKGKTIVYLMEMAKGNPEHPKHEYPANGAEISCTLNVGEKWLATFKAYRTKHGLPANTAFVYDALIRGLSIQRTA